jgi:endonuclease/exonuclease/phosphatase (EEP) superfamily protein YafD
VAEYLFVPLPLLLLVSIWKHDWISLSKLSIPLVIFVTLFGHLFWPIYPNQVEDDEQLITVMSFNVLHSNKAYEAIVESIHSSDPDIVGFQELRPASAKSIVEQLKAEYPYGTLQFLEPGQSAGLLSKFPVEHVEWFDLPPMDIALHAIVQMDGEKVHIYVVHLSPNNFFDYPITEFVTLVKERYGRRESETIRLKQIIQDLDRPVLLMCDCNMTDTSETYARLDSVLNDSFSEAGWGIGHTLYPPQLPFPIQRIDYVWHSEDFTAIQAYVGQDGGSDHLPIVAKLRLNP